MTLVLIRGVTRRRLGEAETLEEAREIARDLPMFSDGEINIRDDETGELVAIYWPDGDLEQIVGEVA